MLIDACQAWLNRNIAESGAAREHARALEGKRLDVEILGAGLRLELAVEDGELRIAVRPDFRPAASGSAGAVGPGASAAGAAAGPAPGNAAPTPTDAAPTPTDAAPRPTDAAPADAALRGSPLDLIRLLGPDPLGRLKRTRATLIGEVGVAEAFSDLLRLAEPDLEDDLAGWIGDVPAHELGRAARGLSRWSRKAGRSFERNAGEYLTEESRLLPGRLEARAFGAAVERLRDDVERLEQRLRRLEGAAPSGRA